MPPPKPVAIEPAAAPTATTLAVPSVTTSSSDPDTQAILASTTLSNVEKAKLLFPDFAPNKKLRFSRLFGNSFTGRDLDMDWKYGKKKKKHNRLPKENGLWTKVRYNNDLAIWCFYMG